VLLGLCILHNDSSVAGSTVADLTNLVQKRLGSDMFIDKIGDIPKHEGYIRALKSPQLRCGSTADLLFDHQFCELFRSVDRDITGLLRQQSSATPQQSNGEPAESVDLLQYKNFIREQDIKMQQWVEAYNVTSQELTLLRQQHEELTATVEILRDQNAVLAAQAVNHTLPAPVPAAPTAPADLTLVTELQKQLSQKEEYIAELEARVVSANTDINENLAEVVTLNNSQKIEIENLRQQLESLRQIMMTKDEEIMKLKNDLPIQPKSGSGPVDRFENMFMTSMEVEAQKKRGTSVELQLKCEELEQLRAQHEADLARVEAERDTVEAELLANRHRVAELEEVTTQCSREEVERLEQELRDSQARLEEVQQGRDSPALQAQDSALLQQMLRQAELQLVASQEEAQVLREQNLQLAAHSEQQRLQQLTLGEEDSARADTLESELQEARAQMAGVTSEQEDLLVMLSDQEEKIAGLKSRLREVGVVVESEEDETDLT